MGKAFKIFSILFLLLVTDYIGTGEYLYFSIRDTVLTEPVIWLKAE